MSTVHGKNQDYWTIRAMQKHGGSFVQALGTAAERADDSNLSKIKETWPEYWSEYEGLGEELQVTRGEA